MVVTTYIINVSPHITYIKEDFSCQGCFSYLIIFFTASLFLFTNRNNIKEVFFNGLILLFRKMERLLMKISFILKINKYMYMHVYIYWGSFHYGFISFT